MKPSHCSRPLRRLSFPSFLNFPSPLLVLGVGDGLAVSLASEDSQDRTLRTFAHELDSSPLLGGEGENSRSVELPLQLHTQELPRRKVDYVHLAVTYRLMGVLTPPALAVFGPTGQGLSFLADQLNLDVAQPGRDLLPNEQVYVEGELHTLR